MSIAKPFHRNYRDMIDAPNSGYSSWAYIIDRDYSQNPTHYIRAFLMIQDDLKRIFEYVEPSDTNLGTYSFRIHELFMRVCIEIEANFKAILKENVYSKKQKQWSMSDFKKVDTSHRLSSYKIKYPVWNGTKDTFEPFKNWKSANHLPWYQAYNQSKHNRHDNFKDANFDNLLNAFAALQILISSQFRTESFSTMNQSIVVNTDSYHDLSSGIGGYLLIKFPTDWLDDEKYSFDWSDLKKSPDRFQKFDYDQVS